MFYGSIRESVNKKHKNCLSESLLHTMAAFKALRDVSVSFEEDLKRISSELFTAKVGECFEDGIANMLRDLSLHAAKHRLLQAKSAAASPEVTEQPKDEQTTISDYADTAKWKLTEIQIVKALTQSHAVRELIDTKDSNLDPEMVERKEKILEQMAVYKEKEMYLLKLDAVLKEKNMKLAEVRGEWDAVLAQLRERQVDESETSGDENCNPLRSKLQSLEDKSRLIRALLARLATTARSENYDWLTDPHNRLNALKLARR